MRTRLAASLAAALLLAACGGSTTGSDPTPSAPAALLVVQEPESASSACPHGAVLVRAGLDADGDGLLDPAEVATTSRACAPAPAAVLTRTSTAAPGADCASGGTKVESGRDANGDGTLQDGEVERVAWVCAPPDAPPPAVLVQVSPEPTGPHCYYPGTAVASGADADGDGLLDPEEIATTTYLCGSSFEGSYGFTIASADDLSLLNRAFVVKGNLVIESPTLESVRLDVTKVTGSITVRNNAKLWWLELTGGYAPELGISIPGSLVVTDNPLLRQVTFPTPTGSNCAMFANSTVAGDLVLARNASLDPSWWDLCGLARVGGKLDVRDNAALQHLYLYGLKDVRGDLIIAGNEALEPSAGMDYSSIAAASVGGAVLVDGAGPGRVDFPNLATASGLTGRRLRGTMLFAPALRYVSGSVSFEDGTFPLLDLDRLLAVEGSLSFLRNTDLTWNGPMSSLEWIGGDLVVRDEPKLFALAFPALRSARTLEISGAALLGAVGEVAGLPGFPALESLESLLLLADPTLAHVRLPALRTLSLLQVSTSPRVPTCELDALVLQLAAAPARLVTGTDDAAVCP
jgi:hypothetical protein